MLTRSVPLALSMWLFSSVASAGIVRGPVPAQQLEGVAQIGVISVLRDSLHTVTIGPTIFQNKFDEAPVPEWQVDHLVAQSVVDLLARSGRVAASEIKLSPDEVAALFDKPSDRLPAEKKIAELVQRQSFPLVLVVSQSSYAYNDRHALGGLTILREDVGWPYTNVCLNVMYIARVWEVRTGREVAWQGAMPCIWRKDSIPSKAKFSDLSADERDVLKRHAERLVGQHLAGTLTALNLLNPDGPFARGGAGESVQREPVKSLSDPPPRVVDSAGVPAASFAGLTCARPFELTKDCTYFGGSTKVVKVDGVTLRVAGNESGTLTMVMPRERASGYMTEDSNSGYEVVKRLLESRDLHIIKATPVQSLGIIAGYAVETVEPSYHLWDEYVVQK